MSTNRNTRRAAPANDGRDPKRRRTHAAANADQADDMTEETQSTLGDHRADGVSDDSSDTVGSGVASDMPPPLSVAATPLQHAVPEAGDPATNKTAVFIPAGVTPNSVAAQPQPDGLLNAIPVAVVHAGDDRVAGHPDSINTPLVSHDDLHAAEDGVAATAANAAMVAVAGDNAQPPVVTTDTRHYFEQDLCNRLNTINAYSHLPSGIVTLRTIPYADTHWGIAGTGSADRSEYLCVGNEKITLRAIAEVVYPNFFKRGMPFRKAGLLFKPLLANDTRMASRLLRQKSMPVKARDDAHTDGFWASTWMGSRNMTDDQIPSFQRVYDALDVFSNQKVNMGKYDTSDLKTGDIVVVEMAVIRWPIKDENASGKKIWRNRKEWKKWNVDFRLESVAVLYPGSDYADEPVEETDLPDDLAA